jgi:AraC family transcriptional regulator, positive regulator of tynA and feaB
METYSADALPPATRASAWNDLYSRQLNNVEFTPEDRHGFAARLSLGRLGPIQFARMTTNRSSIQRTQRHITPGAPRLYSFLLQARGSSVFNHCGQEARLNEGDFALCDSAAPHDFTVDDESMVIMLRVDAPTLKEHLPTPERFCGLHLRNEVGLTSAMSAMIEKLHWRLESGFTSAYDASVARHLLEMMAMSYAIGFENRADLSAVVKGRQSQVIRYIEDHLRDPKLSPASVAAGLRISPRYLRTVFAGTGERVSAYIIRRRLEECAKQIRNPAWAGHTLTEIAFAWGFNSAAHFTRTFHEQFGMTPRDYRRIAQH